VNIDIIKTKVSKNRNTSTCNKRNIYPSNRTCVLKTCVVFLYRKRHSNLFKIFFSVLKSGARRCNRRALGRPGGLLGRHCVFISQMQNKTLPATPSNRDSL